VQSLRAAAECELIWCEKTKFQVMDRAQTLDTEAAVEFSLCAAEFPLDPNIPM
jgi:hypothetical protein